MDPDSNDTLTYALSETNQDFWVSPPSGEIMTNVVLDRESKDAYQLHAMVSDGLHNDTTIINITVLDTNDNAPEFSREKYEVSIGFDSEVGRSVIRVLATDKDIGNNAHITHWLTGSEGKFAIDPDTGLITVANRFNDLSKGRYDLRVFAGDHGWPPLRSNVSVTVFVNNSNRHPPQFKEFVYEAEVAEDVTIGSVVIQVNVTDADEGLAGEVKMSITGGNEGNAFVIQDSGRITTAAPLDYEATKHYQLIVQAQDGASDPKSSSTVVRISVTDVNDNAPVFLPVPSTLHLQTVVAENTPLYTLLAWDDDSELNGNNKLLYSLQNHADMFNVDSTSGVLTNTVDLNKEGIYELKFTVHDQGTPSLHNDTTITLDVRAELKGYPVFSRTYYKGKLNESAIPPVDVLQVEAKVGSSSDHEGIFYNISTSRPTNSYTIGNDKVRNVEIHKLS